MIISSIVSAIVIVVVLCSMDFTVIMQNLSNGNIIDTGSLLKDNRIIFLNIALTVINVAIVISYCKVFEKRTIASMGLRKNNIIREYFTGFAIGGIMIITIALAWNFVQGNILGIKVSGLSNTTTLYSGENLAGFNLLTGGDFGLEGGIVATVVLIIGITAVLSMNSKKSEIAESNNINVVAQR